MTRILFAARPATWDKYREVLPRALSDRGVDAEIIQRDAAHDPATIDWIVYAPSNAPDDDFTPYTRLKGVLTLWAGVEKIEGNRTLTAPLTRMVDDGLTRGMVEWVAGHVLRHHLGIDAHVTGRSWDPVAPPLAADRTVAMLGLGALGGACAQALVALGFPVIGWSRAPKDIAGVRSVTGRDGLRAALSQAEIVVLLTPLTSATRDLMNAETLGWMRDGAVLINPGRGALIDDAALLAELPRLGHATLDTFRVEPLPAEDAYWSHPKVTVTPHIASATRPGTAAEVVAENIRRGEAGEPLLHLVDRRDALA